jgi:hypothetical protein
MKSSRAQGIFRLLKLGINEVAMRPRDEMMVGLAGILGTAAWRHIDCREDRSWE